jgi:uncharacterized membrane protein YedE/YeeE
MEQLMNGWPWYISGLLIVAVMALLLFFGKSFGFSSNLRTLCAACGADKVSNFFDFDWKSQLWNLLFLAGSMIGGFLAAQFLTAGNGTPELSERSLEDLNALGLSAPNGFLPEEIFSWEFLASAKGIFVLVIGGFLVGFGSRWAGGCTSGHAISGLSNLQWPSLLAVIGFFIGGLITTWFVWPALL